MIYDSHCHLSPIVTFEKFQCETKPYLLTQSWPINLMMTNHIDEEILTEATSDTVVSNNPNILFNLGIHPWFTHLYTFLTKDEGESDTEFQRRHYQEVLEPYSTSKIDDTQFEKLLSNLPAPIPVYLQMNKFETIIKKTHLQDRLNIGEIGLDKLARIPLSGYLCNPDIDSEDSNISGLSNYKVSMDHQLKILKEHFKLVRMFDVQNRDIVLMSLHCVNAHGILQQTLREFDTGEMQCKIHVSMHSYSGSVDNAKMLRGLENVEIWFGVSEFVNLKYEKGSKKWKLMNDMLSTFKEWVLTETDAGVDTLLQRHSSLIDGIVAKISNFEVNVDDRQLWQNWCRFRGLPVDCD